MVRQLADQEGEGGGQNRIRFAVGVLYKGQNRIRISVEILFKRSIYWAILRYFDVYLNKTLIPYCPKWKLFKIANLDLLALSVLVAGHHLVSPRLRLANLHK